jgi:acyl carrier protein
MQPVMTDLSARLQQVFSSVFGAAAPDPLREEDSPATIGAWDSLSHITLVLALESEFDVQFDAGEIPELNSVGVIRQRLTAGAA